MPRNPKQQVTLEGVDLFSLEALNKITGLTPRTLRRYISTGRMKACKIGACWYVSSDEISRLFTLQEEDFSLEGLEEALEGLDL